MRSSGRPLFVKPPDFCAGSGIGLQSVVHSDAEAVRSAAVGLRKLCVNARRDSMAGILGQAVGNHAGIG